VVAKAAVAPDTRIAVDSAKSALLIFSSPCFALDHGRFPFDGRNKKVGARTFLIQRIVAMVPIGSIVRSIRRKTSCNAPTRAKKWAPFTAPFFQSIVLILFYFT
jgi:hypothetical protein